MDYKFISKIVLAAFLYLVFVFVALAVFYSPTDCGPDQTRVKIMGIREPVCIDTPYSR